MDFHGTCFPEPLEKPFKHYSCVNIHEDGTIQHRFCIGDMLLPKYFEKDNLFPPLLESSNLENGDLAVRPEPGNQWEFEVFGGVTITQTKYTTASGKDVTYPDPYVHILTVCFGRCDNGDLHFRVVAGKERVLEYCSFTGEFHESSYSTDALTTNTYYRTKLEPTSSDYFLKYLTESYYPFLVASDYKIIREYCKKWNINMIPAVSSSKEIQTASVDDHSLISFLEVKTNWVPSSTDAGLATYQLSTETDQKLRLFEQIEWEVSVFFIHF